MSWSALEKAAQRIPMDETRTEATYKAGHFFTRWFVRLSIRPFGNCAAVSFHLLVFAEAGHTDLLTARLAGVLIAIAGILEFRAPFEEF